MPAKLFCKTGELAGTAFFIDREATIGRLDENQVMLHPLYISGHHARIYFDEDEGRYFLEDCNSSNGTLLDGTRITEPVRLDRLHVITFARQVDFIFQVVAEASPPAGDDVREKTHLGDFYAPLPALPGIQAGDSTQLHDPFSDLPSSVELQAAGEKTAFRDAFIPMPPLPEFPVPAGQPPAETPSPAASPTAGQYVLEVTLTNGTVEAFALKEGVQFVGREPPCDIILSDSSISRRHARITVEAGQVTLEDLGSKNATFVDGDKLRAAVELRPDSRIRFGLSINASLKRV